MKDVLSGYQWYLEKKISEEYSQVSPTRDIFRARWNHMDELCVKLWEKPNEAALFSAVIGELGDRGQGILSSLKQVLPTLQDDQVALNTAFEKKISGRSPEHRGNGLKFVRNVINQHLPRGLVCLSGKGEILLGKLSLKAKQMLVNTTFKKYGIGTFSLVFWGEFE